ncbi:TRIM2_3 [Mytilus edulis]|uniref:RanBP-type and C3HC4-type zinc finger-containing protein 1 n=1 Tax=Mytilus edulis TaxID=6550 RepID=A0A8S3ULP2_MYTED|nr:TRIM2_3 [Mytilus edulis]
MAECVDSQKTIDILTCAICLERFIKPKSLPCLHTFCEGCILTFITSELEKLEGNNHIECPVCRATVQLPKKECTPKEFVDQMPTNFLINGLLEKETTKRSEIKALKCDNVVTIEDEASKLCTDVKLERLKMDITNVSNDFDTLLSHYTECLQSNETQYEDKQKMIEISISTIISKVKALEITKKAELKKYMRKRKHILEDKMDTCTNCKKTVVSDKQTLEINIETASEVQVMFEAQKIASQVVFKFGNATLDKKSPGISLQSGATSESSADIKFVISPSNKQLNHLVSPSNKQLNHLVSPSNKQLNHLVSPSNKQLNHLVSPSNKQLNSLGSVLVERPSLPKPASSFTFTSSVPIATASPFPAVTEITDKSVTYKASTFLGFSSSIIQSEHAKKDEKKGFENQSNPKEEIWKCNGCLMSNKCDALKCPACGTLKKPGVIKEGIKAEGHPQKKDGENGFGDLLKNKEGGWKCDECLCSNNSDVLKYPVCDIMKPCDKNLKEDIPKEKGKSSAFGSNAGGFNFGGKRGFTFGTDGESNTKAASEFTFPTPDLAKKNLNSIHLPLFFLSHQ